MKRTLSLGALVALVACGGREPPPVVRGTDAPKVSAVPKPIPTGPARPALSLVPRPLSLTPAPGVFTIDASTKIRVTAEESRPIGERLAAWLGLDRSSVATAGEGIVLRLERGTEAARDPATLPPADLDDEAYELEVTGGGVTVKARTAAGLFYGAQTVAQLAGARRIGMETPHLQPNQRWTLGCGTLRDAPRYRIRAMHLDVARHFFSREVVERYVDLLSFYRFNVFHWHLTDDQGFRIEIKGHPELTAVGGKDGSYSQVQAAAVVQAARERMVTVLPEVDMPGHMRALLASHPELSCTGKKQDVPRVGGVFEDVLCAGNESTYTLVADLLGELTQVFPSKLIHVGGDEVPTTRWSACPKCQAVMRANKVSASGLEGVFMKRVAGMLAKLGRRPMVWDDATVAELTPDTVVVAWQSKERGENAAKASRDVVMAPYQHVYLNTHQSNVPGEPGQVGFLPWTKVRVFDPMPDTLDAAHRSHVLGGEGALWTEHVETSDEIDTMVMPRMAALAESLWSGPAPTEQDFVTRFNAQLPMLDASKVQYFVDPPVGLPTRKVLVGDQSATLRATAPALFPGGVVRWSREGEPTPTSPVFTELRADASMKLNVALFLPSGRRSATFKAEIVKETPRPAQPEPPKTEPGAMCTYIEGLFYSLPPLDRFKVKMKRARVPAIDLADATKALATAGIKVLPERFAMLFDGFVRIPADGVYRFAARADDGVRVEIDSEKLFEDDGEHDARETSSEIALLKGLHKIRVEYFQGSEGKALELKMDGPGVTLGKPEIVVDPTAK